MWGAAHAAFPGGLAGLGATWTTADDDTFVGVHPVDTAVGRRTREQRPARVRATRSDRATRPVTPRRRQRAPASGALRHRPGRELTAIGATLFPGGEPPMAGAMQVNGERIDVRYVVGVLMGNRDLIRRLAAEQGLAMAT